MRNFREYPAWNEAIDFCTRIYRITKLYPESEKYGIVSQMRRAVVSIPSNIAEGSAKTSPTEFARFLEIALGSSYEAETQLIISHELEYIDKVVFNEFINISHSIQAQLSGLIKTHKGEEIF